jgi:hypothetical protein
MTGKWLLVIPLLLVPVEGQAQQPPPFGSSLLQERTPGSGGILIDDIATYTLQQLPLANMAVPIAQGAMNINGDMTIDQMHEGAAYTNTNCGNSAAQPPPMDRWYCTYSNFWGSTTQRVTDAPAGYVNSLKITGGTGISIVATQAESIISGVDGSTLAGLGWGTGSALSVLFDFCIKASQAGTYTAFIQNHGQGQSYLLPYTIATPSTWQCYSSVVPGPTAGTWSTSPGSANVFFIGFDLGAGSNFQGAAGWNTAQVTTIAGNVELRQTTGATLQIVAVHLRPLSTTGVPYSPRPYGQELALAQQWIRKSFAPGTAPAQSAGLAGARCVTNPIASGRPSVFQPFDVPMAGVPAILTYNPSAANANWRDVTASADVTVTVDPSTAKGATGFELSTGATVTTIGDDLCIHYIAVVTP